MSKKKKERCVKKAERDQIQSVIHELLTIVIRSKNGFMINWKSLY